MLGILKTSHTLKMNMDEHPISLDLIHEGADFVKRRDFLVTDANRFFPDLG